MIFSFNGVGQTVASIGPLPAIAGPLPLRGGAKMPIPAISLSLPT